MYNVLIYFVLVFSLPAIVKFKTLFYEQLLTPYFHTYSFCYNIQCDQTINLKISISIVGKISLMIIVYELCDEKGCCNNLQQAFIMNT